MSYEGLSFMISYIAILLVQIGIKDVFLIIVISKFLD